MTGVVPEAYRETRFPADAQFTTAILVFALIVACIVIYNTFTMLLSESLLLVALAIALGVTFGIAMVHAFIKSVGGEGLLSIPYSQIVLYAVIGACAALVAAVLPARRVARTSVVAAMAET